MLRSSDDIDGEGRLEFTLFSEVLGFLSVIRVLSTLVW